MNGFKKGLSFLLKIFNYIGCLLILFLTSMIMIDVCGRLFFNHPLVGTPEAVQMAIVAIAFLMIPYVQSENKHLNVTMFYGKMPDMGRRIVDCVTCLLGIGMFLVIAIGSWKLMQKGIAVKEYEGDGMNVRIPTFWLRGTIVVCSIANIVTYLTQLISRIRGEEMVL